MLFVLFFILGVDQNVVDEHHDEFIRYIKYARALVRPKDITKYS